MPHARATLEMAEAYGGFDPAFPAKIKKDIAHFEQSITTTSPENSTAQLTHAARGHTSTDGTPSSPHSHRIDTLHHNPNTAQ